MNDFPPHCLWTVWVTVVVLVAAWGLLLELAPIFMGHPDLTLSWILWDHFKFIPPVVYFALGGMNIGVTVWAMWIHFPSGGRWGI